MGRMFSKFSFQLCEVSDVSVFFSNRFPGFKMFPHGEQLYILVETFLPEVVVFPINMSTSWIGLIAKTLPMHLSTQPAPCAD